MGFEIHIFELQILPVVQTRMKNGACHTFQCSLGLNGNINTQLCFQTSSSPELLCRSYQIVSRSTKSRRAILLLPPQLHNLPPNHTELAVTGDDEGIFGVDAQFLYALKPLDREKQPSYSLQVASPLHQTQIHARVYAGSPSR